MSYFDVQVSLGHTAASIDEIEAAVTAGARFCTHLGNGVPADLPRHSNVVQRLLSVDELVAFFIPDGIHLPPRVLKNFFRAKPEGKALFTTDCMATAGAPCGMYSIGGIEVEVGEDRVVRQPGKDNFAGSALSPREVPDRIESYLGLSRAEAVDLYSNAVTQALEIELRPNPILCS